MIGSITSSTFLPRWWCMNQAVDGSCFGNTDLSSLVNSNWIAMTVILAVTTLYFLLGIHSSKSRTLFQSSSVSSQNSKPSNNSNNDPLSFAYQQEQLLLWWRDLAPPFALDDDDGDSSDNNMDEGLSSDDDEADEDLVQLGRCRTHFFFLVHGHRGFSRDLSYLQQKMKAVAASIRRTRKADATPEVVDRLVVHSSMCNERKTDDGIASGGDRLVNEILQTMRNELRSTPSSGINSSNDVAGLPRVTFSILGNSLGGLYARYAISKLALDSHSNSEGCDFILDNRYAVSFNIFCTTATPHLGIAGHTFFTIPRSAEIGVAHAMGDTGRDLFRLNDLMKRMATTGEFLQPLQSFRQRIAYANAYSTDFPVPVRTAAFLSESSSYPHHFIEQPRDSDGLVIASFFTPPLQSGSDIVAATSMNQDSVAAVAAGREWDEQVEMSRSLDALGWKKVFVDVRKEMIPLLKRPSIRQLKAVLGRNIQDDSSESGEVEEQEAPDPVALLKQKGPVVASRDVAAALNTHPLLDEEIIRWPRGHNMLVAFSRNPISTYLNKPGRPVVNALAHELVTAAYSWEQPGDE